MTLCRAAWLGKWLTIWQARSPLVQKHPLLTTLPMPPTLFSTFLACVGGQGLQMQHWLSRWCCLLVWCHYMPFGTLVTLSIGAAATGPFQDYVWIVLLVSLGSYLLSICFETLLFQGVASSLLGWIWSCAETANNLPKYIQREDLAKVHWWKRVWHIKEGSKIQLFQLVSLLKLPLICSV